ncbi:hypothetical protein P7C73_g3483, partial [Tremellales sp. Uapishka_1]
MAFSSQALLQPDHPSTSTLEAFLTRHRDLLQLERLAEEEQTRLLNSNCSPKLLEKRGLALGGLGVSAINIGLGGKNLIELHRPLAYHTSPLLPPHTFRNGDPVRIEPHVSTSGPTKKAKVKKADSSSDQESALEGVVYRVSAEKVVVAVDGGKEVDLPERLRLLKLANSVTFDRYIFTVLSVKEILNSAWLRMDRTLTHLQRIVLPDPTSPISSSHAFNLPLIESLLGIQQPSWLSSVPNPISSVEDTASDAHDIEWFGEGLNDSQKEAIRFCLQAETVACIHGPPGTGKTHTLIELIFQLLARPSAVSPTVPPRILICTPSNLALDNLLLRLHALSLLPPYSELLPPGAILRLGHPTRVHKDLVSQTLDWRAANGDDGELVRDVKRELEGTMSKLSKKRGEKGSVKGKERGMAWGEVRELRKEHRSREGRVVTNVVNNARVVLSTCHGAGSKQLNNLLFDIAIIDEATQAVEAVCWVPILKARKLILAGDPQQLPPTILSKEEKSSKKVKTAKVATKNGENKFEQTTELDEVEVDADADDGSARREEESDVNSPIRKKSAPEAEKDGLREDGNTSHDEEVEPSQPEERVRDHGGDDQRSDDSSALSPDMSHPKLKTQLRPPRTLETTLFDRLERLYGNGIKRVLEVQYRMNAKIASFPSTTLYSSRLLSSPSVADRTLLTLPTIHAPSSDEAIDALSPTLVFFDTAGCEFYERTESEGSSALGEGSKSNENEGTVVAKWARGLVELGVPSNEIAIVTPYQAQVSLISELLHEEFPEMTIGSVDGLQGQEREARPAAFLRDPADSKHRLGNYLESGTVESNGRSRVSGRISPAERRHDARETPAGASLLSWAFVPSLTRFRDQCIVGDSATVAKGSSYLKKWMAHLDAEADVRWAGN